MFTIDSEIEDTKQANAASQNNASISQSMLAFLSLENLPDYLVPYLGKEYSRSLMAFSASCKATLDTTRHIRKSYSMPILEKALKNDNKTLCIKILTLYAEIVTPVRLLRQTVYGNEFFVNVLLEVKPKLFLDKDAIVTDLSGKKIAGLTSLQAALCAGDMALVHMIIEVLYKKQREGVLDLSIEELQNEIRRQILEIYPNGVGAVEEIQYAQAEEFTKELEKIFKAINNVSPDYISSELDCPGRLLNTPAHEPSINARQRAVIAFSFNKMFHEFRESVDKISQERIFNPFLLLLAFMFYDRNFNEFNREKAHNRRALFWRQIIGYMQRHLPANYWQEFARGIHYSDEKLSRSFEFKNEKNRYMRAFENDIKAGSGLGYKFAARGDGKGFGDGGAMSVELATSAGSARYAKFLENKSIKIVELTFSDNYGKLVRDSKPAIFAPYFKAFVKTAATVAASVMVYKMATDSRPGGPSFSM